jgi:hypothetical protein
VTALALVATLGALVGGVEDQTAWLRWPAIVGGTGCAAASLLLARRRNALATWYAVTGAVLVLRLVREAVGA